MLTRLIYLSSFLTCLYCAPAQAQARKAPPGTFRDLDDEILGDALSKRSSRDR